MRILLDDHLSPRIAAALRERGHDVVSARERGWRPMTERALWERAVDEGRVVVTADAEDFPPLYALYWQAGARHPGLVVVGPTVLAEDDVEGVVRQLLPLLAGGEDLADQMVLLRRRTESE